MVLSDSMGKDLTPQGSKLFKKWAKRKELQIDLSQWIRLLYRVTQEIEPIGLISSNFGGTPRQESRAAGDFATMFTARLDALIVS